MVSLRSRIISAIIYADLFQYPLTVRELQAWIPIEKPLIGLNIRKKITMLIKQSPCIYTPPFIYLRSHKKNITHRINRHLASSKKWKHIFRVAKLLQHIPSILLVGVTGGLAMNNAEEHDDIDLLIITKKGSLWITRFLTTILIEVIAKRRHPEDKEVKNAICLNMFLSESAMKVPINEQGWYTAHELLQMVPLWERSKMYRKYLKANSWAQLWFYYQYMAALKKRIPNVVDTSNKHIKWYHLLEHPIKKIQLWYMRNRITTEVISDTIIRFHPYDARVWIKREFKEKLHQYKIPLDKKFNQI